MTLELHATSKEVMRAVDALQQFGREHGIGERDLFELTLALEECGSNIVDHALRRNAEQKFRVRLELAGTAMTVELRDRGPAFDPTGAPARKAMNENDLPGGWGIHLVRRYMDEIRYKREGEENVLTLIKMLKPSNGAK
jgi:serine/threonine-protein kinase RsbW